MIKDGIIIVNKPAGISSFKVCETVKKRLKAKKVGHGGTLDPFAKGLMIVGINKGTRLLPFFIDANKEYKGKIILGEMRDSFDITGEIVGTKDFSHVESSMIYEAANRFIGAIKQKPPIFSAIKHKGKPLYKYARKGIAIEKEERFVFIEKFDILNIELPEIEFYIKCSKGTYIRSIANDFGISLKTFAYLSELERIGIGEFKLKDAAELDSVEYSDIIDFENVFNFKKFHVKEEFLNIFENGNPLLPEYLENFTYNDKYFYVISKNCVAISEFIKEEGIIKIKVLHKKTLH